MAWSWSHSNEAYSAAEQNVQSQDREWLEIVYGEWHAAELDDDGELDINSFNEEQYNEDIMLGLVLVVVTLFHSVNRLRKNRMNLGWRNNTRLVGINTTTHGD